MRARALLNIRHETRSSGQLPVQLVLDSVLKTYCEYGPGHTYNGLGFVWGRERGGGNWKFYVHAIQPAATFGNATEDRRWADL
jgi:hypothetical protein